MTGFDGRCDAIYITNTTIAPVNAPENAARKWRKRLLALPEEPIEQQSYDVVVIGGGIPGCYAAFTASKNGCKVALIHEMEYLGGQIGRVSCLCGKGPYENQSGPYVGPKKIQPVKRQDGGWDNAMNLAKSHFWEYGQWQDPYTSSEEIRDYLLCAIIGTYANVREKQPDKYKNLSLAHLTNVAATGAFRSYLGDYVLNENDIENHTDFRLGNWLWVERDFRPYTIPFRSLYSADIDNLLFAGKHISATHIASSTVKLIGNGGYHGIAVGIAASLCERYDTTPRGIYQNYIEELKGKVKQEISMYETND